VVQGNIDQKIKNKHTSYIGFILEQYAPQTKLADGEGADVIIWPEAAFPGYFRPGALSLTESRGGQVLKTLEPLHATLLLGAQTANRQTNLSSNSAFEVRPDLTIAAQYDKHHLVPFGEYVLWDLDRYLPIGALVADVGFFKPGTELPVWELPTHDGTHLKAGMLICYDAIFPEIVRAFAREAPPPDILVNGTNDAWYGYSSGPYQFLAIVQLRAIEAARTVVRPAYAGVSAVVLPTGELAPGAIDVGPVDPDLAPDRDEPARLLLARAPLLRGRTLYTTIGDLFAYGCALAAAGALLAAWVRKGSRAERPRVQGRP